MNKDMKGVVRMTILIIAALGIAWAAWNISDLNKEKGSNISNIIKKHNGITQEHSNPMFPTVAKPANNQVTVMFGDSIRVMPPKPINVLLQDTLYWQREDDSINAYLRHWYEVLDTNSDGDIDSDTIIEW
jgi:hypothetical protein